MPPSQSSKLPFFDLERNEVFKIAVFVTDLAVNKLTTHTLLIYF